MSTVNPNYHFDPHPKFWDDSCHKYPSDQTRRLDAWMNSIAEIVLTEHDYRLARAFAAGEHRESRNYKEKKVAKVSGLIVHERGYIGQCAFAKWAGVPFEPTTGSFRTADFPQFNVEVRTRTQGWHDMKVRPGNPPDGDDDSWRMVMAIYFSDKFPVRLAGWIPAKIGKTYPIGDWGEAGQPVHAVPQDDLRSMADLKKLLALPPSHGL